MLTEAGQKYVETGRVIMKVGPAAFKISFEQEAALQKNRIRLGFGMGRSSPMMEEIIPAFLENIRRCRSSADPETGRKQMMELQNGSSGYGNR